MNQVALVEQRYIRRVSDVDTSTVLTPDSCRAKIAELRAVRDAVERQMQTLSRDYARMTETPDGLTGHERILLYLLRVRQHVDEARESGYARRTLSQESIGLGAGMSRGAATLRLKKMVLSGHVEIIGRLPARTGGGVAVLSYGLTALGLATARTLTAHVDADTIPPITLYGGLRSHIRRRTAPGIPNQRWRSSGEIG